MDLDKTLRPIKMYRPTKQENSMKERSLVVHEDDGRREEDICGLAIELINEETSLPKLMSIATIYVDPGKSSQLHYHLRTEEIYYLLE